LLKSFIDILFYYTTKKVMLSYININMKKRIYIKVFGLVQGVFFRVETKKIADKLGLFGWVENSKDDTVIIVAEGPEEQLLKLEEWAKKGPEHSMVEKIESETKPATNEFSSFKIRS